MDIVKKKQFVLNDACTGDYIRLRDPIERIFTPGRTILMSMCHRTKISSLPFCPGCGTTNETPITLCPDSGELPDVEAKW
jgi:hypothetical protein